MTAESSIVEPILPVGFPIEGTRVLVLDESGEPIQPGDTGEIVIESPYIARYFGVRVPEICSPWQLIRVSAGITRVTMVSSLQMAWCSRGGEIPK